MNFNNINSIIVGTFAFMLICAMFAMGGCGPLITSDGDTSLCNGDGCGNDPTDSSSNNDNSNGENNPIDNSNNNPSGDGNTNQ